MMELLSVPLLVAVAVAGPDLHCGTVGGASSSHVEAEAGLATDDAAIGVEGPLLIGTTVAVVDLHPGACCRGVIRDVEALVAVHLQLTVGQGGPLLIGTAVAVPDLQQSAVGRGLTWHVQASVRSHTAQNSSRTASTAVTDGDDVRLNCVF